MPPLRARRGTGGRDPRDEAGSGRGASARLSRELADGQEAEGARSDPAIEGRSPSPAQLASLAAARLEPVSPRSLTAVIFAGHRLIHLDLAELVLSTKTQTGSG